MLMNHRRQSVFETTKIRQATSRNNTRCKAINKISMEFKRQLYKDNKHDKQQSVYTKQNNKHESQLVQQ